MRAKWRKKRVRRLKRKRRKVRARSRSVTKTSNAENNACSSMTIESRDASVMAF
ncbi:hypothetical protein CIHG_02488 [Coccidioides immitis H538.4]|uniref:60S ribosomal protein L41 n=5 Tax=Coccidioides TaxID=5500 RepID=E9DB50_COCPS|nr:hypothetical protein CPSG_07052 [Coccidioides posadasii str. Silveira]KMM67063.1 hypothetical protein CPAG_03399 [Coccidioides posadasii RMSCC 3488]KMP03128.1 hypothetical protein CIRG_02820 [Coccidioides immitis RMSCC 2394]KMU76229.1 hypothetical protein CISG_05597 [Coccidioides immitis RMSCC 3703]KMU84704.1 hypothetical protein CIHG_02488 [Coccidioides immitis H538.4]